MDTGTDSGLDENIRRADSSYNRSYVALYTVWASILENGHVRTRMISLSNPTQRGRFIRDIIN